jgi:hypothetical protein
MPNHRQVKCSSGTQIVITEGQYKGITGRVVGIPRVKRRYIRVDEAFRSTVGKHVTVYAYQVEVE